MDAIQCAAVVKNLPIVQAVAEGREVYFAQFDWRGRFIRWAPTRRVNLNCLTAGLYSIKPRYQCMKPGGKPTPVPYPDQAAAIAQWRAEKDARRPA